MNKMNKTLSAILPAIYMSLLQVPLAALTIILLLGLTGTVQANGKNRFTNSLVSSPAKNAASANKLLVEQVSANILRNTRLPYSTQTPIIIVDQDDFNKFSKFEDLLNAELINRGFQPLPKTNMSQDNAFAWDGSAKLLRSAGFTVSAAISDDEKIPLMIVTPPMMTNFIKSDANRLALLVGHELSHISLQHYNNVPNSTSLISRRGFNRAKEEEADHEGLRLALLAKYDQDKMVEFAKDFFSRSNRSAVNFSSHPSDLERLAYLDKKDGKYWEAYHLFVNGTFFLQYQDYETAESEFNKVVAIYKESYEALNNRGYARLMRYIDNLEPGDIQRLGIGHLLLAGYYKKPTTIVPKGFDEKIWLAAVEDFQSAEKLNKSSSLVQANLGLAYLIAPSNILSGEAKTKNLQMSFNYFQKAIELMKYDSNDDSFKLAVYNNAAVAAIARNDKEAARILLALVENDNSSQTLEVIMSLPYNKALLAETRKDYSTSLAELENFLTYASSNSKYRSSGEAKYKAIANILKVEPKNIPAPSAWIQKRGVYSVNFKGKTVSLATVIDDKTMTDLGCQEFPPKYQNEKGLVKYFRCSEGGMEIAAGGSRNEIILIRLFRGSQIGAAGTPTINIGETGIAALSKVGIGLPRGDFEKITGFPNVNAAPYLAYSNLNLFVRYESGKVAELLVRPIS